MVNRRDLLKAGLLASVHGVVPQFAYGKSGLSGRRNTLTVAVTAITTNGTLTTLNEPNNNGEATLYSIFDPLIETNRSGDMSLQPGLAVTWKRIDSKTLDVKLRKGVKFHNGDTLRAEDVVFSFEAQGMVGDGAKSKVPATVAAQGKRLIPSLAKVEAIDDLTVRFTCASPNLALEKQLTRFGTEPFSKKAFLAAPNYDTWAQKPVGTGPFIPTVFDRDKLLEMTAFGDYWGGKPNVDKIIMRVVPETSSRVNGLLAREYDLITNVPPDQIEPIKRSGKLEIVGGPVEGQLFLQLVKTDPPLANPLIRRAMSHSVNRELIAETLWGGRTFVPQGRQFQSYGDMYIAEWKNPEYDLKKARALLAQAGYKGEVIPFRIMNNYYPMQVSTAQVLVDMWSEIGLNVKTEFVENWSQIWKQNSAAPRGLYQWSNGAQFGDPLGSFLIQQGPDGIVRRNKEWFNDEFDKLSEVLVSGEHQPTRRAAFKRMLQIAEFDDPSYITLSAFAIFYAKSGTFNWNPTRSRAMNFRANNLTFPSK